MEKKIKYTENNEVSDFFEPLIAVDTGFPDDQNLPVGKDVLMHEVIQSKHYSLGTPNLLMELNDHRKKKESVSEIP